MQIIFIQNSMQSTEFETVVDHTYNRRYSRQFHGWETSLVERLHVVRQALKRVLLTFTGFHDPFAAAAIAGNEQEGPILTLIRHQEFDLVQLLGTPNTRTHTAATRDAILARHPNVKVEATDLLLDDPTDYAGILAGIRRVFAAVSARFGHAAYFVGTASGTPQMHACWLLLTASGEIPARLLQARNAKFVTTERPYVQEIDPTTSAFPTIRARALVALDHDATGGRDPAEVVERLGIVGDHPAMVAVLQRAANLAPYDVPALLMGESGTGKEKLASFIHHLSMRGDKPFVAVNCAAIPTQLAESTLFGHVKGAFTGAIASQPGKFTLAQGGTLFLDEVGELAPEVQGKLLRALQDKEIEPVGSAKAHKVDCRIIAATNRSLKEAIRDGRFRNDLYYRLAVGEIEIPPLRERRSDISKLAVHFLDEMNARARKARRISPEALSAIQSYDWPGNVRELCNVIQDATIQATSGMIDQKHLRLGSASPERSLEALPEPSEGFSLEQFLGQVREKLHQRALEIADGNASKASRLLGVTPQAVAKFQKSKSSTT